MPKYALGARRVITMDGRPYMMLVRVREAPTEADYPTAVDADAFASEVVAALNAAENVKEVHRRTGQPPIWVRRLLEERARAADAAFAAHDFGGAEVEDASGWEHREGSNSLCRTLYLAGRDGSQSTRTRFAVEFEEGTGRMLSAGTTF